jgi:hypothetical protein
VNAIIEDIVKYLNLGIGLCTILMVVCDEVRDIVKRRYFN